jgi:hypothetical protein
MLAKEALELSALALASIVMQTDTPSEPRSVPPLIPEASDPAAFLEETANEGTRFYRASDDRGAVLAAFYDDGRVRVAGGNERLAGALQNGHAHLLDLKGEAWSELFVRTSPGGDMQLELRGGPYDARVFVCTPIPSAMVMA